jgi:hypothetical protein
VALDTAAPDRRDAGKSDSAEGGNLLWSKAITGVRQRIDAPASKKRDWQGGNGA